MKFILDDVQKVFGQCGNCLSPSVSTEQELSTLPNNW